MINNRKINFSENNNHPSRVPGNSISSNNVIAPSLKREGNNYLHAFIYLEVK